MSGMVGSRRSSNRKGLDQDDYPNKCRKSTLDPLTRPVRSETVKSPPGIRGPHVDSHALHSRLRRRRRSQFGSGDPRPGASRPSPRHRRAWPSVRFRSPVTRGGQAFRARDGRAPLLLVGGRRPRLQRRAGGRQHLRHGLLGSRRQRVGQSLRRRARAAQPDARQRGGRPGRGAAGPHAEGEGVHRRVHRALSRRGEHAQRRAAPGLCRHHGAALPRPCRTTTRSPSITRSP